MTTNNQKELKVDYLPIEEIIKIYPTWFSESNRKLFKSKWDSYALKNEDSIFAYFISSEKHESYFANINEARKYTIRKFNMLTNRIEVNTNDTIFKFQKYATKKQAEKALREYLKNEQIQQEKLTCYKEKVKSLEYDLKKLETEKFELQKQIAAMETQQ